MKKMIPNTIKITPATRDTFLLYVLSQSILPKNTAINDKRKRAVIVPIITKSGLYSVVNNAAAICVLSPKFY